MDKDLIVSFVKSYKWGPDHQGDAGLLPQTGDLLSIALIVLILIAFGLITYFIVKKFTKNSKIKNINLSGQATNVLRINKIKIFVAVILAVVFTVIFGSLAFASGSINDDAQNINVNFVKDTKVYVDPDGSCTFDTVAIRNDEINKVNWASFSFSSIEKLGESVWTFTDKTTGDIIYQGKADQSCEINKEINPGKTCEIEITSDIDKDTALSLIDKNVFSLKFSFSPMKSIKPINLDRTDAGDEVHVLSGQPTAVPQWKYAPPHTSGWEFDGWFDIDGNPIDFSRPVIDNDYVYAHYKAPNVPKYKNDQSVFLVKGDPSSPQQGLEIFGNYVFSCEDSGPVNVYDYSACGSSDVVKPIAKFNLGSSHIDNHVNNVEFGPTVYPGQQFPLLYISNGKVGSSIEYVCYVEQIEKSADNKFSSKVVQEIWLDNTNIQEKWRNHGYVPIFGAPSWLIDRKDNAVWVFSAYKRTTPSVTKNNFENEYIATKFALPQYNPDEPFKSITLHVEDILDQVVFPYDIGFTQSGCMNDGVIYYCYGVGKGSKGRPPAIRIYDTKTKKIVGGWDLTNAFSQEPEDIVLKDGFLLLNCNSNWKSGDDLPRIYKFALPKDK